MTTDILTRIKDANAAKQKALSGLHKELGYASAEELAAAILEASSASLKASAAPKPVAPRVTTTNAAAATKGRVGRRIDAATKQQVLAALKAGQAGARVAKEFGVSYPTIHNWKTELGLVKPRSGGRSGTRK